MKRLTHEADFGFEDWEETLFLVESDPNGAYNILDIARYHGEPEFDSILKNIVLRLADIEDILGDEYELDRLRELVEADKEGRCVVLPVRGYTDKDGEQALNSAMNTCFYHNNPVTRYIADAVAEKLTREAAEAALKGDQHEQNL